MQTLVAFALNAGVHPERIRAGIDRVERWYGPRWGQPPRTDVCVTGLLGLALWQSPKASCRWPAWVQAEDRTVATLHVPLGHERLLGRVAREHAPLALAAHLRRHPDDLQQLVPPFVLAELDAGDGALTLLTDGLGLGRLHEVRTAEGRFWSNRPLAALRFAGRRAEPDRQAWQRMAASDWAMGDLSPYLGVSVVRASTRIIASRSGVRSSTGDVLRELLRQRCDPLTARSVDRTATALTDAVSQVSTTWPGVPTLSLSGGRDSRLVAAAFVAAGRPFRLKTYGGAVGEAATARQLVELLPEPVEHELTAPPGRRDGRRRAGGYDRARQWHDVTEGLRPAVYLRGNPPQRLPHYDRPLVCGVGGEFGHAPGYPDDVEQLERLPLEKRLDGYTQALRAKVTLPRGVAAHALDAATRQIRAVVDHAAVRGVTDAKALDWFYADERLRRFGMAGESAGRVLPLLTTEFVGAALGLSTAQSRASALHTALIERLVPQWAGVNYYTATLKARQAVTQQRLWEESDVELLADIVAQPNDWGEAFDVAQVQAMWRRARQGRAAPRDELLLQRVVWRAAFTDHLAAVNAEAPTGRPRNAPAADPPPSPVPVRRRSPVLVLAIWANDVPLARRLARTRLGRRVRRFLGA